MGRPGRARDLHSIFSPLIAKRCGATYGDRKRDRIAVAHRLTAGLSADGWSHMHTQDRGGTGDLSVVAQWEQDDRDFIINGDDTLTIAPGALHELEISKIGDGSGENILTLHNTAGYPRQILVRTAPQNLLESTQLDAAN